MYAAKQYSASYVMRTHKVVYHKVTLEVFVVEA